MKRIFQRERLGSISFAPDQISGSSTFSSALLVLLVLPLKTFGNNSRNSRCRSNNEDQIKGKCWQYARILEVHFFLMERKNGREKRHLETRSTIFGLLCKREKTKELFAQEKNYAFSLKLSDREL